LIRDGSSPVWTDEELRREEVRGIFALGVLATILGYLTYSKGLSYPTGIFSQILYVFLQPFAIIIFVLWGGYVLLTAISMSGTNLARDVDSLKKGLKAGARLVFYMGSILTLVLGIFLVVMLDVFGLTTGSIHQKIPFIFATILVVIIAAVYLVKDRLGIGDKDEIELY
jgi:hypothetical protein